jgi:hypothetical protein
MKSPAHPTMTIFETVVLHLVNKDEPISQALACLLFAGAVTLAPGTYVVDNRHDYTASVVAPWPAHLV